MKSLFNTSCDKDLVDFRQFWSLKETFWQNSYRIFRFWYRYTLFRYEIGKIAHLVSHQVSRDLLKETFCTKVSLSTSLRRLFVPKSPYRNRYRIKRDEKVSRDVLKETFHTKVSLSKSQVSYKTWRKRTKSVKSHISFLSEVSRDVLKETFCRKVSFRQPKLLKKSSLTVSLSSDHIESLLKTQVSSNLIIKSCDHCIDQSECSKPPNLVRKSEISPKKYFHLNSLSVYNSSAKK